jgi:hypothetical protein
MFNGDALKKAFGPVIGGMVSPLLPVLADRYKVQFREIGSDVERERELAAVNDAAFVTGGKNYVVRAEVDGRPVLVWIAEIPPAGKNTLDG